MSEDHFENNAEDKLKCEVLSSAEKHLENREYLDAIRDFNHLLLLGDIFEGFFGLFRAYAAIFFTQDHFPCFMAAGDLALMFGDDALEYGSHPSLYEDLAAIYFIVGETQSAVDMIEKGLEKYQENFCIIRDAANYLSCLGGPANINRAISLLDRAIKHVEENREDFKRELSDEAAENGMEDNGFDRAQYLIVSLDREKRDLEEKMKNTQPELEF